MRRCWSTLWRSAPTRERTMSRARDDARSRRCSTRCLGRGETLVAAGEKRPTKAGGAQHLAYGDGGAAVCIADQGAAKLIGYASASHDLVDIYASHEHPEPYAYEERFVRETAVARVVAPTIKAACAMAGIAPSAIAFAAVHEPLAGSWRDIARATGVTAPNLASDLAQSLGDLGAAHALFAFALACDKAKPGDRMLLAGFGSGCDALVFEMTGAMPGARKPPQRSVRGSHSTTMFVSSA